MTFDNNAVTFRISDELFFMTRLEPEYRRKVERVIERPVTDEQWAEYHDGVRLLAILRSNQYYREGGPDEGSEIEMPEPERDFVYAESHDEWLARCRKLAGIS